MLTIEEAMYQAINADSFNARSQGHIAAITSAELPTPNPAFMQNDQHLLTIDGIIVGAQKGGISLEYALRLLKTLKSMYPGERRPLTPRRYLTKGGNILQINPTGERFFASPTMAFIREVSEIESAFLQNECIEISLSGLASRGLSEVLLPVWKHLWSVIDQDDSGMIESRANNGGAYGERTERSYYISKMPSGEWKVRVITRHWSTSEFCQDDSGRYTNEIGTCFLKNVEGSISVRYQGREDFEDVIERHSDETTLEIALRDSGEHITSPYTWDGRPEYISETIEGFVTFSLLRQRVLRLYEIGWTRPNKRKFGKRGNAGANRGRK